MATAAQNSWIASICGIDPATLPVVTNAPASDGQSAVRAAPVVDSSDTGKAVTEAAAAIRAELTDLVKRMLQLIAMDPAQKAALAKLATDAQASLKRNVLDVAAAAVKALREALERAQRLTPDVISGADAAAVVLEEHPLSKPAPIPLVATAEEKSDPHLGLDFQAGYPWSLQATLVIKDFDLKKWGDPKKLSLDFFHEPNLSFTLDPKSGVTEQQMVALFNLHWIPPWQREIEVPLNLFLTERLSSQGPVTGGAQLQVEQHITGWFSITANISGTVGGDAVWSAGGGVIFHFDPKRK